jgi:helicase
MEFIEGNENSFRATRIGKRVSELYLDPFTAFSIINGLNSKKKFSELFYLFLFVNSSEFSPWLSVSKKAEAELWESLAAKEGELPIDLNREQFYDFNLLRKFNSSLMLESWVNEKPEQLLLDEFNVQPGILYSKLKILDWLAYSSIEIAKMLSLEQHFSSLSKMRRRIASGIKEELIALCEVRGIGRVRARRLWRANIKGIADLKKADVKDLGKILGEKVAEKIKEAIGQ